MDPEDLPLRPATAEDWPRIAALVVEGFATYEAFAPPGWSVPGFDHELEQVGIMLSRPSAWCAVADDEIGLAGHVGWLAASEARLVDDEPGLAHFWQLFVRRDRWGSGLAAKLQTAGLEAAAQHGFTTIRLFTPSGHTRARRFYEREGWKLHGEFDDEVFGMPITEYRRRLGPAGGSTAAG